MRGKTYTSAEYLLASIQTTWRVSPVIISSTQHWKFDFFSTWNYCKDAAETFPRGLSWLMPQFLQLCLLKSLLFLSLGNFSITPIKHQLQIHERLHAISSSVRSNETSISLACFILLQLGNILSKSRQNLFTRRAKKKQNKKIRKIRTANNSLKSPVFHDETGPYETGTI